ncbi:MAG TPA: hypothetical protein VK158_00350 [Acidobacteriota bacterium]|nr:hypothetical protein [Acidobacteriota bacterium]
MIKKNTRAQSALEFLFTYAWAFLIILIMIAALAFFGVLDPARFIPDKCVATTGFACVESRVTTTAGVGEGHIQIRLVNSGGKVAIFNSTPVMTVSGSGACVALAEVFANSNNWTASDVTLNSGQEMVLRINCSGVTTPAINERLQIQISGNYTDGGTLGYKPFDLLMSSRTN